jgi:hypothetical protein
LNRGSTAEVTEYISVNFGGTNSVFNVVGWSTSTSNGGTKSLNL